LKLEYRSYEEAKKNFRLEERWEIFDGTRENFNIAHECIDRHPKGKTAIRIKFDNKKVETYTFGEISELSSRFANMLESLKIEFGDKVAIMLNHSLEFYVSFFGTLKRGTVAVPLSLLLAPEAIRQRIKISGAKMLIAPKEYVSAAEGIVPHIIFAEDLLKILEKEDNYYKSKTSANDLAIIQFTSGTTKEPRAIPYKHASATLTAVVMKFAFNLREGDTYFCPATPAWGQGIWYATVGPLIFGYAAGNYSGRFNIHTFLEGLEEFEVTDLLTIPRVYHEMMKVGIDKYDLKLKKIAYSGGTVYKSAIDYFLEKLNIPLRSIYGSTETGVLILDYAFDDYVVKPGSMGKAMLGVEVKIVDDEGRELPPNQVGQIAVVRAGKLIKTDDLAYMDDDGYFWFVSRYDDVIKYSGYRISPEEVESAIMRHPKVQKVAVIGSPHEEYGEIVKAFVVLKPDAEESENLKREIQELVKKHVALYAYPKEIEFVKELPETPDGKIKRKELKERERAKKMSKS